ncbi:MAG: helix-turn-helix transcriptional regulator [Colwellia sp.]
MESLLSAIKNTVNKKREQPFALYTAIKEQNLLNVPIAKPLLIVVLKGDKELGADNKITCHPGDFIFLSASPAINMRNIPKGKGYFALLIEFDFQDFNGLQINTANKKEYFIGKTTASLASCLQQFVESSLWAPQAVWSLRKREIISLLCHMGHSEILSLLASPQLKDSVHKLFIEQGFQQVTIELLCKHLAVSESTLRRKLKLEGTSVQQIKVQARLGLALHLLQTTRHTIGIIADKCGYQSQSRFTDRFKQRFGLTPSELRKTKMTD